MLRQGIILIWVNLISIVVLVAQDNKRDAVGIDGWINHELIANSNNPTASGGIEFDTRYQGVKGSPLLYEEWMKAEILFKGRDQSVTGFFVNVDLERDDIIASVSGKRLVIKKENVQWMKAIQGDQIYLFKCFDAGQVEGKDKGLKVYEVIYDNEFVLLKSRKKKMERADFSKPYGRDKREDTYTLFEKYFISTDEKTFQKLKLKRKSLVKVLPQYEKVIKAFFKKKAVAELSDQQMSELIEQIRNK